RVGDSRRRTIVSIAPDREAKEHLSSFNQAVCGLRFHFRTTFPRDWVVSMVPFAATTIQKVFKAAAVKAGLLNEITPQALRA
ncbi:MAG: hypothetical protein ACKPJD_24340, partial [Planctomycetaceae bacterium]